jgi:hypothetical protein
MAGRGSTPGERRGGRAFGTPNKVTAGLRERLAARGADPLDFLAGVVADTSLDLPLRLEAAKSLMPYSYPRLSAIDLAAAHRQPIHIQILRFSDRSVVALGDPAPAVIDGEAKRLN